jgi:hypothetical protein
VPTPTPRSTDLLIHCTFRGADFTYHSDQQCAARCKGSDQRKLNLNRLPRHQVRQSCFWVAVFPVLKMCRWFAYISPTEPCLLSDVLITPANSISKQCSEHYLPKLLPHKKDKDLDHTSDELLRMRNSLLNMDGLGVACTLNLLTISGLLQGHFHIFQSHSPSTVRNLALLQRILGISMLSTSPTFRTIITCSRQVHVIDRWYIPGVCCC